jgi:hypothetical protein
MRQMGSTIVIQRPSGHSEWRVEKRVSLRIGVHVACIVQETTVLDEVTLVHGGSRYDQATPWCRGHVQLSTSTLRAHVTGESIAASDRL